MSSHPAETERGPLRFPPPVVYVSGLFAAIVLERIQPTPDLPLPLAVVAGLAGGAASAYLDLGATQTFARKKTAVTPWRPATTLVTKGPYRYTRNPMYLGMGALFLGLALAFGFLWGLAILPAVLLVIDRFAISREEKYLENKFGDPYRDYKTQVRRWL